MKATQNGSVEEGMFYDFLFTLLQVVLLLICAVTYWRLAEMEKIPGWIWGATSAAAYLLTWRILHYGVLGNLLGQAALLIVIGAARTGLEMMGRRK